MKNLRVPLRCRRSSLILRIVALFFRASRKAARGSLPMMPEYALRWLTGTGSPNPPPAGSYFRRREIGPTQLKQEVAGRPSQLKQLAALRARNGSSANRTTVFAAVERSLGNWREYLLPMKSLLL